MKLLLSRRKPPFQKREVSARDKVSREELAIYAGAKLLTSLLVFCATSKTLAREPVLTVTQTCAPALMHLALLLLGIMSGIVLETLYMLAQALVFLCNVGMIGLFFLTSTLDILGGFFCGIFGVSRGLSYFHALILGGLVTLPVVVAPHSNVSILVLLAINMVCITTWDVACRQNVITRFHRNLTMCIFHLQSFLVYTGLRLIWPLDTLAYKLLAWTTGTVLCVSVLTVYCVMSEPTKQKPGNPNAFLEW